MPDSILAIDPGTACGWARTTNKGTGLAWGTWDIKPSRHEGAGMRWLKLEGKLLRVMHVELPEVVVYEAVARHAGTHAAHVYGGIVAVIQTVCVRLEIPYTAQPVGTIKRHATGKGNASKAMMLGSARERWGDGVLDDNAADALWLLDLARTVGFE